MPKPSIKADGSQIGVYVDGAKVISVDVQQKTITIGDKAFVIKDGIVTESITIPGLGSYSIASDGSGKITVTGAGGTVSATVNFSTSTGDVTSISSKLGMSKPLAGTTFGFNLQTTITPISFNNQITFNATASAKAEIAGRSLVEQTVSTTLSADAFDALSILSGGYLSFEGNPNIRRFIDRLKDPLQGQVVGAPMTPVELSSLFTILSASSLDGVFSNSLGTGGVAADSIAVTAIPYSVVAGEGGLENPEITHFRDAVAKGLEQEVAEVFGAGSEAIIFKETPALAGLLDDVVIANTNSYAELDIDQENLDYTFTVYDANGLTSRWVTYDRNFSGNGNDFFQHYNSDGDTRWLIADAGGQTLSWSDTDANQNGSGWDLTTYQYEDGDRGWEYTRFGVRDSYDTLDVNFDYAGADLRSYSHAGGDNGWVVSRNGLTETYDTFDADFDLLGNDLRTYRYSDGDNGWVLSRDATNQSYDTTDVNFDFAGNDLRTFRHSDGDNGWVVSRNGSSSTWDTTEYNPTTNVNLRWQQSYMRADGDTGWIQEYTNGQIAYHTTDANPSNNPAASRTVVWKYVEGAYAGDSGWEDYQGGTRIAYSIRNATGSTSRHDWSNADRNSQTNDRGWEVFSGGSRTSWQVDKEQEMFGQIGWRPKLGGGVEPEYGFYRGHLSSYYTNAGNYGWRISVQTPSGIKYMYEEYDNGVLQTEHSLINPLTGENPAAMFVRSLPSGITRPDLLNATPELAQASLTTIDATSSLLIDAMAQFSMPSAASDGWLSADYGAARYQQFAVPV